jgi:hypothetical protein
MTLLNELWVDSAEDEAEISASDTIDAQKALFGNVRPWKYRMGGEIEDEYVESLMEARSKRDALLIDLLISVSELPRKLRNLASHVERYESQIRGRCGYGLRWEAWKGAPHSAVYLVQIHDDGGSRKTSLGNLFSSEEARLCLRDVIGRNKAIAYLSCLDEYRRIKEKITAEMASEKHAFTFVSERSKHPIEQWVNSVGPFWEALVSVTQQNIDRYLELDEAATEVCFAFNFERQPIRWRSLVCRAPLRRTDPLGPGFPEFRVVTNHDRLTGKRQTMRVDAYKQRLAFRELARELSKQLGRAATKEEVKAAHAVQRKRAFSPWITKELISHCKLGRHTTKINGRQRRLKTLAVEWTEVRERLAALIKS